MPLMTPAEILEGAGPIRQRLAYQSPQVQTLTANARLSLQPTWIKTPQSLGGHHLTGR